MKVIRCGCGCIYPDDMARCPSCQCATDNNRCHVLNKTNANRSPRMESLAHKSVNSASYNPKLATCIICNAKISSQAESCPHCGQTTGVHVCQKCGSINTKVISGASKATSIFLWGPFAANKVLSKFQCKDCGHKW